MLSSEWTRRRALGLLAGCVIAAVSRRGEGAASMDGGSTGQLLRMARHLFPHDELADQVYLEVLAPLQAVLAEDSSLVESLNAAQATMDDAAGGDWLGAESGIRVAALRSIESTAIFRTVREAVRTELYYHPTVWKLIGFEGSSVEYGGYIDRGFDDIDWLPGDGA